MPTTFLRLLASVLLAAAAHAQVPVFTDGFENGLSNWTTTGLWNLEADSDSCGAQRAPFPDGTHCAYFGIDGQCNFATGAGVSGDLQLAAPVAIPTGFHAVTLHCWMLQDTEPCSTAPTYDVSSVDVSSDGGSNWTTVGLRCLGDHGATSFWNPRGIDLTSYAGQSILLRFRFDSVDDFANTGLGVMVDRVTIQGESGAPFCTLSCPCGGPFHDPIVQQGGYSGCRNSFQRDGELAGSGSTSVANDGLVLRATDLPPSSAALLVQASAFGSGGFDGEGRACLVGGLTRLGTQVASAGVVAFPPSSAPPLSIAGAVPLGGGTRHYQVRYRNVASYCNASNFNWTNGYTIVWAP